MLHVVFVDASAAGVVQPCPSRDTLCPLLSWKKDGGNILACVFREQSVWKAGRMGKPTVVLRNVILEEALPMGVAGDAVFCIDRFLSWWVPSEAWPRGR